MSEQAYLMIYQQWYRFDFGMRCLVQIYGDIIAQSYRLQKCLYYWSTELHEIAQGCTRLQGVAHKLHKVCTDYGVVHAMSMRPGWYTVVNPSVDPKRPEHSLISYQHRIIWNDFASLTAIKKLIRGFKNLKSDSTMQRHTFKILSWAAAATH